MAIFFNHRVFSHGIQYLNKLISYLQCCGAGLTLTGSDPCGRLRVKKCCIPVPGTYLNKKNVVFKNKVNNFAFLKVYLSFFSICVGSDRRMVFVCFCDVHLWFHMFAMICILFCVWSSMLFIIWFHMCDLLLFFMRFVYLLLMVRRFSFVFNDNHIRILLCFRMVGTQIKIYRAFDFVLQDGCTWQRDLHTTPCVYALCRSAEHNRC